MDALIVGGVTDEKPAYGIHKVENIRHLLLLSLVTLLRHVLRATL